MGVQAPELKKCAEYYDVACFFFGFGHSLKKLLSSIGLSTAGTWIRSSLVRWTKRMSTLGGVSYARSAPVSRNNNPKHSAVSRLTSCPFSLHPTEYSQAQREQTSDGGAPGLRPVHEHRAGRDS